MNNITKILSTQGISALSTLAIKLTPEQKIAAEERTRQRFAKLRKQAAIIKAPRTIINEAHEKVRALILKDPLKHFQKWSQTKLQVFNSLINQTIHLSHEAAVSQERMALDIGCTRQRVNELIGELSQDGLIQKTTHGQLLSKPGRNYIYRQNCVYDIPSFIFKNKVAAQLHKILPALSKKFRSLYKPIAIALLFVNSLAVYPKISCLSEYTTVNNRYIYKYNYKRKRDTSTSPPFVSILTPEVEILQQHTQILEVDDMADIPISLILQKDVTPRLGLTRKGQLHLSVFHDGALLHGLEGLEVMGTGDRAHDFRLFVNLCQYYIKKYKHENTVDLEKVEKLMKQYGCKPDAPFFYSQTKPVPEYVPDKFSASSSENISEKVSAPPRPQVSKAPTTDPNYSNPIFAQELQLLAQKLRPK